MNASIMVVFVILVASLCGLAYAATEASKTFNEKIPPRQGSVTGGSGGSGADGGRQSVENLLNLHSEETVARKNKDLRDRTEKLMVRHCGNIETTLGRWASTVRKEVPKDDYAIASHVLHGQIKAAAIGDESGMMSSFLKNASDACASVPKNKGDGRLSSFWFLPCMTMYRRKYHSVPGSEQHPEKKQIASYLRFDSEIEEKLASLDVIMACPKLVVDLAGKQLDHEYTVEAIDKLIAQGTLGKDKRDSFIAKLGPFPDKLSSITGDADQQQQQPSAADTKSRKHDEL
jgi:hypothetical protein